MAARVSRRLKRPPSLLLAAAVLICSAHAVLGATVAGAGAAVAAIEVKCTASSKGHSVLHGQQPVASSSVQYWDRTPTALKAGIIKEVSVYYDSKQECIAGIKVTHGAKPGWPGAVSYLMGIERGPGFYEKLLMLDQAEFINRVDVGYNSRCVQYVQWYTSHSRTLRAGASSSSSSSKTGVAVPENSDWHLASLRGTFSDGVVNQLQAVWGDVQCRKVDTPDDPVLPAAARGKHAPAASPQAATTSRKHSKAPARQSGKAQAAKEEPAAPAAEAAAADLYADAELGSGSMTVETMALDAGSDYWIPEEEEAQDPVAAEAEADGQAGDEDVSADTADVGSTDSTTDRWPEEDASAEVDEVQQLPPPPKQKQARKPAEKPAAATKSSSSSKQQTRQKRPVQVQLSNVKSSKPAASTSTQQQVSAKLMSAPAPAAAGVQEDRAAAAGAAQIDFISDAVGLNMDPPDLTALYTTDVVLPGTAVQQPASLAPDAQQQQQQQQQLQQSIASRLVAQPQPTAGAQQPAVGGLTPVTPTAVTQGPAAASPLDILLQQQQQQQQPSSSSSNTATPGSPAAQQLLSGDLLQQQRKQQLLQQHQKWQQQELEKLQQQQQQSDAGSTGPKTMKFRAIVPPSVTCAAAPLMCDTQQALGHPAFCAVTAPHTQSECVGGCCMSSGKCSGLFGLGSNCATAGLGAAVPGMQCTGLNNGQDAEVLDGSMCQNLGCRLSTPGCLTSAGGTGGHCVGRVVALGPLSKGHPEGAKFLGYPCIDAAASSKTLNLFGELTDNGYYVAQQWSVCNCNGAAMPQGTAAPSTADAAASLPAGGQQLPPAAGGAGAPGTTPGSIPPEGLSQVMQLLSLAAAGNSSINPAAAAAAAAELLKQMAVSSQPAAGSNAGSNAAPGANQVTAGLMAINPAGLEAAGQLQGLPGQSQDVQAVLAGVQGWPSAPVAGSNVGTTAGNSGSTGGLNWGELLKDAAFKAAAGVKAGDGPPADKKASVVGGLVSTLLTAAGAGNKPEAPAQQQQQQQGQAFLQGAGQQQQQPAQQQDTVAGWMGLLSKVLSAAKGKPDADADDSTADASTSGDAAPSEVLYTSYNTYDGADDSGAAVADASATDADGDDSSSYDPSFAGSLSYSDTVGLSAGVRSLQPQASPFMQAARKGSASDGFGAYDDGDDYDAVDATATAIDSAAGSYSPDGTRYGGTDATGYAFTTPAGQAGTGAAQRAYFAPPGAATGAGRGRAGPTAGATAIAVGQQAGSADLQTVSYLGAPSSSSGNGINSVMSPQGAFDMPGGVPQQQQQPRHRRDPAAAAARAGTVQQQQLQQQSAVPAGSANAASSTGFVTNRPGLYGGQNLGPAARAARARGMHRGGIAPMSLGMPPAASNMRQGGQVPSSSNASTTSKPSGTVTSGPAASGTNTSGSSNSSSGVGTSPAAAAVLDSGKGHGNGSSSDTSKQQQHTAQPVPTQAAGSPGSPKRLNHSLQQQHHNMRRRVRQPQQQQVVAASAPQQVAAAAVGAQPANVPNQQQPQMPQQPPVTEPVASTPQQQQQEQDVEVHVESVPAASAAVIQAIPQQPAAGAAVAPKSAGSSPAAEDAGSTFVMPGGPPLVYRGKGSQGATTQQPAAGAAPAAAPGAGSEHRGAGVVINDEAWRQQTSGQQGAGGGADAQQPGQRQMWRPTRRL